MVYIMYSHNPKTDECIMFMQSNWFCGTCVYLDQPSGPEQKSIFLIIHNAEEETWPLLLLHSASSHVSPSLSLFPWTARGLSIKRKFSAAVVQRSLETAGASVNCMGF